MHGACLHKTSRLGKIVREPETSRRDLWGWDQDETEMLVILETVSRPRCWDRDHNPANFIRIGQPTKTSCGRTGVHRDSRLALLRRLSQEMTQWKSTKQKNMHASHVTDAQLISMALYSDESWHFHTYGHNGISWLMHNFFQPRGT